MAGRWSINMEHQHSGEKLSRPQVHCYAVPYCRASYARQNVYNIGRGLQEL